VYGGTRYSLYEDAPARVTHVLGEFPWRVEIGETVGEADYIAPPHGLAKETAKTARGTEINYTHSRYLGRDEVAEAFGVASLPDPSGISPLQPNPHPNLTRVWLPMLAILIAIALFLRVTRAPRVVLQETWNLAEVPAAAAPAGVDPAQFRSISTRPFALHGKRSVEIRVHGDVADNQSLQLDGEIVDEDTGLTQPFDTWSEFSTGVDDEGTWTENERDDVVFLPAFPAGEYTIDLQAAWSGAPPPSVVLTVREGAFRWSHFILAMLAVSLIPAWQLLRYMSFEKQRWADSDFSPYGSLESAGDDDDDDDED
jgi:hypothetical protein